MMKSLLVSSVTLTNPRSTTPSNPPPPGWTLTKMPRRRNSRPSKRSLRASVCQFYKALEVVREACRICQVASQEVLPAELPQQPKPTRDLRSRRLIKLTNNVNLSFSQNFRTDVARKYTIL